MIPALIAISAVIVITLIVVIVNLHIVPQAHAFVVERLGSYHATWSNGLHFKLPFIEKVSKKINLMEQVADFPPAAAVMVAEPAATAVTFPSSTVATFASEVDQVTVLSVASEGATVACSI